MRYTDAQMKRLLLKVEAGVHRMGWDRPAHLVSIIETRPGAMTADPWPLRLQDPVGEFLAYLGDRFAAHDDWSERLIQSLLTLHPSLYGIALVNEVWGNEVLSPEQQRDWYAAGNRLVDHPASYEARTILIITVYGTTHTLLRQRGEKPIVDKLSFDSGRAVDALHAMIKAIVTALPDERCDREAVARLSTLTFEQTQAKWEQTSE